MKDLITKEQVLSHPIQRVWSAITNGQQLSTWFIEADFKAEPGYRYTFTSKEDGCTQITGEIKQANPYTLIYTWIVAETNVETTVSWTLTEIEGGTHLLLEHSGISKYSGDTALQMFESFSGGWTNCINLLTGYLKETVHAG